MTELNPDDRRFSFKTNMVWFVLEISNLILFGVFPI